MKFSKYFIFFILCGVMFFFGILAGRSTTPVLFDTNNLQKKLGSIVAKYKDKQIIHKKPALEFYDKLKKPVQTSSLPLVGKKEILPLELEKNNIKNEKNINQDKHTVKKSKKTMTLSVVNANPAPKTKSIEINQKNIPENANYTIQIAAYKDLKEVLKQIEELELKGYPSYRSMVKTGDHIWHRVRIGLFKNVKEAEITLKMLEKDNIKGLIVKRD